MGLVLIKADRVGLVVIVAALVAIAATIHLIVDFQIDERIKSIRMQGVSFARTLSGVPYDQLVPDRQRQGAVQVL